MSIDLEGKTKRIERLGECDMRSHAKNDLTAGDGKKHDVLEGKARFSTQTTSNVFSLLKLCHLPVAFYKRDSETSFVGPYCRMLPWEVVVRRRARGSYLKRHPTIVAGTEFEPLIVEFYLKTKDRVWKKFELPCDDPLAEIRYDGIYLYEPSKLYTLGNYFLRLNSDQVFEYPSDMSLIPQMAVLARHVFLILEQAWNVLGYDLEDEKVEFGLGFDGILYLADVIDNDSWRLMRNGLHVDKQLYRDNSELDIVLQRYGEVAQATESFSTSAPKLLTWANRHLTRVE